MTTTRHIIDITTDLIPGFEAEETSTAKSLAFDVLEWTYVPDSEDAITAADRVVEALITAGWRPTVEEPAAEHQEQPNADAPTDADTGGTSAEPSDAEIQAAAEEAEHHEQWGYDENGFPHCEWCKPGRGKHTRSVVPPLMAHQARAALVAAREVRS